MNSGVSPRRPPLAPKPQVPRKPAVAAVKPQPHPKPKPVTDVSTKPTPVTTIDISTKPTLVTAISTKPEVTTATHSPHKQVEPLKSTGSEERPCEVLPALQAGTTCTVPPNEKSSVLLTDSNVDQLKREDAAKHGKEALNANSDQEKVCPTSDDSDIHVPTTDSSTSAKCMTNSDRIQEPSTETTAQQPQSPTKMSQPPVPKPRRISSELPLAASNEDENNALQQLENAIDTWEAGLSSDEEEEKDDGGVLESKDKDKVEQVVSTATAGITDPGETCDSPKDTVTSGDVTNHVADGTQGHLDADVANLLVENVASSSIVQQEEQVADVNSSQEKDPHREDGNRTVELSKSGMQDQENADLIAPPRKKKSKFVSPTKPPPPPPPSKKPSTVLNDSSSPGKLTFVPGSSLDDHEKQTPEAHVSKKQGPHLFSPHDAGDFKANSRRRLNKPRAPPCPLKRRSRSLNSLLDKAEAEKLFHSDSAENLSPLDRGPPPAVPYKPQRLRSVDTPNVQPAHATLIARSRSFDSLDDVTPTRTDFKKSVQERPRPVPAPRRLVKAVDVVKEEGVKDIKETAEVKPKEREGSKMVRPPRRPPPPPFLKQKAVSAGNVLASSAPGQSKALESIPSVQTPPKPAVQKSTSVDSMSEREHPTPVDRTKLKTAPRPESSEEVFLPNSSELESTPVQGSTKKGAKKAHFSSTIASGIRSFFEKTPSKNKDADSKRTDKPVLHIPPPPASPPEDEEDTEKKEDTIPEGSRVESPAIKPARPSRKAPAPPRPPPIGAPTSAGTSETGITTPADTSESTAENKSPSKERLSPSSGAVTPDEPSKERSSSSGGVTPDKPSKERSPSLPAPFENIKEKLTMRRSSPNPDSTLSSEPKRESFIMRKLSRSKSKGEEDRKKVVPKSTFYIPPPTEETPSEADTENAQSSPCQHRIPPPTSPPPKPPSAALKPTMSKTPSRPPPPANKLFEKSQEGRRTSLEDVSKDSSARNSSSYVDMNISGGSAEDLGAGMDAEYMDMDTSVKADSSENLYQNKVDSTDNLYMNQEGDLYKNETAGDKIDGASDTDDYEEMGAASPKREEKQEEEQEDAEDHYYSMPKERPEQEEEKTDHTYDYADPQHTDDSSDYAEPEPYANPTVPNTDDHEYHEPVLPPDKAPEKDKTTHYYSPVADDTQTQTKVTPKKSKPPRPPPPKPTASPAPLKLSATPPPKPPRSPGCVGFPEDRPPAPLPRQSSELLSPEEEGDHEVCADKARLSGVSEASSNSQVSSEESGSAGAREEAESSEEEEEESSSDEEEGQEEESKADIQVQSSHSPVPKASASPSGKVTPSRPSRPAPPPPPLSARRSRTLSPHGRGGVEGCRERSLTLPSSGRDLEERQEALMRRREKSRLKAEKKDWIEKWVMKL